jgi:hypothetical protein
VVAHTLESKETLPMSNSRTVKAVLAAAAAVAIAFGAFSLGSSGSDSGSAASVTAPAAAGQPPGSGQLPQRGQTPPGFGTEITGAAAAKAKAAALARYDGTIERVVKLADGSYVVHVITAEGEVHVAVSKAFKVTGSDQGDPGGQGVPPSGAAPQPGGTTSGKIS